MVYVLNGTSTVWWVNWWDRFNIKRTGFSPTAPVCNVLVLFIILLRFEPISQIDFTLTSNFNLLLHHCSRHYFIMRTICTSSYDMTWYSWSRFEAKVHLQGTVYPFAPILSWSHNIDSLLHWSFLATVFSMSAIQKGLNHSVWFIKSQHHNNALSGLKDQWKFCHCFVVQIKTQVHTSL